MTETLKKYLFCSDTKDDGILPYLYARDFDGLVCEERSFLNSDQRRVAFFFYQYPTCRTDKLVLFLHGVGPGHKAYIHEIATLCAQGYRVLTLDYSGCGASDGEGLTSLFGPAKDTLELLEYLTPCQEITVVGHSLGGFTGLVVMSRASNLHKAVILSGFLSYTWCASLFGNVEEASAYERETSPDFVSTDIVRYLRTTSDDILFIHSRDDAIVPFDTSTGYVMAQIRNPHLTFHIEENRKHNPNYTDAALRYMNEVFSEYARQVADGILDTDEKKKAYMADKSAMEMTHQDPIVINKIVAQIER